MTKEQIYIEFIIEELQKGNAQNKGVVKLFCDKFKCSDRTFNRYWKMANELFLENLNVKKAELSKNLLEDQKEIQKEIYSQINKTLLDIINKVTVVEEKAYDMQLGKIVVFNREPNPMEIIEAIKEYNRINGL